MAKNIILIGFMGTGKTTVGMRLAEKMNRSFVDMDKEIESLIGMSVADIFRQYGEVRFRSEEGLMAKKLGSSQNLVIATGGGTVVHSDNVAALKENGILICLDAPPSEIHARVSRKKGSRPLLKKDVSIADIEDMLQSRESYYASADIRISTCGKSLTDIVEEILSKLQMKGELIFQAKGAGSASGGKME